MPLELEEYRKQMEHDLVGFSPSSTSVKPVHIANGLFRAAAGRYYDTGMLSRFVLGQNKKGIVPKGHETTTIFQDLLKQGAIPPGDVSLEELDLLRQMVKRVVAADEAVFGEGMESYTAGAAPFISNDRIAQDGGEFVAAWLKNYKSPLLQGIIDALYEEHDPITVLCKPLLHATSSTFQPKHDYAGSRCLEQPQAATVRQATAELALASGTLWHHLQRHPNKLLRLRLSVFFATIVIFRHLTGLESARVPKTPDRIIPYLLDFSENPKDPVAQASLVSYQLMTRSIARFYAWALGRTLRKHYAITELRPSLIPTYKLGMKQQKAREDHKELWSMALQQAKQAKDPYSTLGEALYGIMALEAEGNPVTYLRQLGVRSGLLWPPNRWPTKRFRPHQDVLELLVRSCIEPGQVVDLDTLQNELWKRFGIVVGGTPEDEERLASAGINLADTDALRANQQSFANRLRGLSFARLFADGVLQITA
jgi:hypothetical protein